VAATAVGVKEETAVAMVAGGSRLSNEDHRPSCQQHSTHNTVQRAARWVGGAHSSRSSPQP
jgi:hypothetical protein